MYRTAERRCKVLQILCERRSETIDNLAFELSVGRSTIRRDVDVLSMSFPLYTTKGTGGGVHIVDNFNLGMKYLTSAQCALLERLLESLVGNERELLYSIIKTFRNPIQNKRKVVSKN